MTILWRLTKETNSPGLRSGAVTDKAEPPTNAACTILRASLLGHLPIAAVHHQRILTGLALRKRGTQGWERCFDLLRLCPSWNVGDAVVVIHLGRLQARTIDAGGEAVDRIHSTMAITEITVSRLGRVR